MLQRDSPETGDVFENGMAGRYCSGYFNMHTKSLFSATPMGLVVRAQVSELESHITGGEVI